MNLQREVWLYFNNEADNDDIAASTNACFPARNLVSMSPKSDTTLDLHFTSMKNVSSPTSAEVTINDTITLNIGENDHKNVMHAIGEAINGNARPNFGGFIDVVDDHHQIVGGTPYSRTADTGITFPTPSVLPGSGILSCNAISVAGMHVGKHIYSNVITATADGSGTGRIPRGGWFQVASANDAHIIKLPKIGGAGVQVGTTVYLSCRDNTSGSDFELDTDLSYERLNGVNSATSLIECGSADADTYLVVCHLVDGADWTCYKFSKIGDIDHINVPD